MGICQVLWIALMACSLGVNLSQHGKPKTGTYSFWGSAAALLIELALLIGGGFFS